MSVSAQAPWGILIAAAWLPALVGYGLVGRVADLHSLASGPFPYFQAAHAGLLYVVMPVVVASSFVLFLSPGALWVLALGQARRFTEWIVLAFGASLLLTVVLGTLVKLVVGVPLKAPLLLSLWAVTAALGGLFLVARRKIGDVLPWPVEGWADGRRLLWLLGGTVGGVALLTPKVFWENFNLDGIEAFEFGRSLGTHLLPHWDLHDGVFGFYHNFLLFAYPNHWFISLFGPFEASARLPYFLYLLVLFAAVVALIEHGSARALTALEEGAIWLGLALYTVVQAYDTNYEPFFADLAENAATDTLLVTCFLSACVALWSGRRRWFWAFALMTYAASPGGLLLLAALTLATAFEGGPERGERLRLLAKALLVCLAIGLAYEVLYTQWVLGGANNQFSTKNMLRRLFPPTLTEFGRLSALIFPVGILPALSLFAARRRDRVAWALAVVTAVYFAAIYVQAWTSLHQFTPVMVLPAIIFWRVYLAAPGGAQRWLLPALAVTTVLSLWLSLPRHFQVNQAVREFGEATVYGVGDYDGGYERAVRAGGSLYALLPRDYRLQYPAQPWGTDHHSLIFYATRQKRSGVPVNYLVQGLDEPAPRQFTKVMAREGIAVYVRDLEVWRRDRERELPRVVVSPLYEPILRRTYEFFRAYVDRKQRKASVEGGTR